MAETFRIKLDGLPEIRRRLAKINTNVNKILKDTVEAGAQPILEQAISNAPVRTGFLKRSITTSFKVDKPFHVELLIGPSKSAFYGFMIEFGTVKMPAQKFLGPAFDSKRRLAEIIMISKFRGAVIAATGAL